MARKFRKGDHVFYTGSYSEVVPDSAKYPPGVIIGFRNQRSTVTVLLDGEGLYADWPVDEIAPVDQLPGFDYDKKANP